MKSGPGGLVSLPMARCEVCGRPVVVRKDGTVGKHKGYDEGYPGTCEGTGWLVPNPLSRVSSFGDPRPSDLGESRNGDYAEGQQHQEPQP